MEKQKSTQYMLNAYDRLFLKELDFGEIMPVAVIKNATPEVEASFEHWVQFFNAKHENQDIDFGRVSFRGNNYCILAAQDASVRANLMSQGMLIEHFVSNDDPDVKCYFFDCNNNLLDAGVAPVVCFSVNNRLSGVARRDGLINIKRALAACGSSNVDFELFLQPEEEINVIYMRQRAGAEMAMTNDVVKARYMALNVLAQNRDTAVKVFRMNMLGVQRVSPLTREDYVIAEKNTDYSQQNFDYASSAMRRNHEITDLDVELIGQEKIDGNKVVVSILKNPALRDVSFGKLCEKIASRRKIPVCEIKQIINADGDRLMYLVSDKRYAGEYAMSASYIQGLLLGGRAKSCSIVMMNLDKDGRLVSVDRRLVAKLSAGDPQVIKAFERNLQENEQCAKLNPSLQYFGNKEYGLYIDNCVMTSRNNRPYANAAVSPLIKEVKSCGLRYSLTDAYGEVTKTGGSYKTAERAASKLLEQEKQ